MNNKKIIIVLICFIIILVAGYFCFFNKEKTKLSELFTEDTYPVIDGSSSTENLAKAFKIECLGNENIEINHSKTHKAYINLARGISDMILVINPSEKDKNVANDYEVEFRYNKIAKEGLVFLVNSDNPVNSLTLEQIKDIYTGKITNWSQVGGKDEEIFAYQKEENSSAQNAMNSLVMKDEKIVNVNNVIESTEELVEKIEDSNISTSIIGYTNFHNIDTKNAKIKIIAINEVKPNIETIKSEEYPLVTFYYAVTRGDTKENSALDIIDVMLSEQGQKIIQNAGYIPLE